MMLDDVQDSLGLGLIYRRLSHIFKAYSARRAHPMTETVRPSRATGDARVLSRAKNLLSPSGELIPNLRSSTSDLVNGSDTESLPKRSGFGASIKRKFQEVKTASINRSRSLAFGSTRESVRNRRHTRSQSELSDHRNVVPAHVVHSNTAPSLLSTAPSSKPEEPKSGDDGLSNQLKSVMDITVPALIQAGTPMTKVSAGKQKRVVFRLDADQGQIVWEGKQHRISSFSLATDLRLSDTSWSFRIVPIENIKELRAGADARFYREQFQLSQDYEDRWLTIVYIMDGEYKTLHLIAATEDVFQMWEITLKKLHAIRQQLMSGLGNLEMRQTLWERQYWKGADEESDQKLDFANVETLCKRLHISTSSEDLHRMFKVRHPFPASPIV
jgi:phosphatidylinositol phospholipase C delta